MNAYLLELALKKQRLQLKSHEQRQRLIQETSVFLPGFTVAEYVRGGVGWVREHPLALASVLLGIAVARPRVAARWGRRLFMAWMTWRKLSSPERRGGFRGKLFDRISPLFSK